MQHLSEVPVCWDCCLVARRRECRIYTEFPLPGSDTAGKGSPEDLQLFQQRNWKHSRVLLIFLNEVISLIFGPWSKTNLGFGNSSVISLQQLPEKNWRMELLLFPLFFLCYLASASVTYCLQELHGNSWSWWQHLCICYTRSRETASVQIQSRFWTLQTFHVWSVKTGHSSGLL